MVTKLPEIPLLASAGSGISTQSPDARTRYTSLEM